MGRPAILRIDIISDARGAQRGIDQTSHSFGRLGSAGKVAALGLAAAGVAAVAAAAKLGGSALRAATDLNETISKTDQLFGSASKSVQAFAGRAAKDLGISKQAALDGASTFAVFGRSAGKSGADLAKFSTKLVSTASDLASFHNASPEETIQAIGAGLRGEAEPLRRFGILLDDASLRASALKLGLIKTTKEALTPQQKVLAAQQVILGQVGAAQGDFARTSGGLANQQRILSATFENVKASIGQGLLPIALKLVGFANTQLVPMFEVAKNAVGIFLDAFRGQSSLGEFDGALNKVNRAGIHVREVFDQVAAFIRNPLLPTFRLIAAEVQAKVLPVIAALARNFVTNVLPAIRAVATFVMGTLVPALARALGPVLVAVRGYIEKVSGKLNENRESFIKLWNGIKPVLAFLAEKVAPVVGKVVAAAFTTLGTTIGVVIDALAKMIDLAAAAVDKLKDVGSAIKNSKLGKVGGWVFGSTPVLGMVPALTRTTPALDGLPRGLATASLGDAILGLSVAGVSGGTPMIVDRRTIDARVFVDGALDPVAVAAQLERIQQDQAIRLGRLPSFAPARA